MSLNGAKKKMGDSSQQDCNSCCLMNFGKSFQSYTKMITNRTKHKRANSNGRLKVTLADGIYSE